MAKMGVAMTGQPGFFDLDERYAALSAAGDPLLRLGELVDFEVFRAPLLRALRRSDRGKGGRPPYDPVLMFEVLVLQALYNLSDDQTEFQIRDRLSFMRFLRLGLHDRVPDAKTIRLFRELLVRAKAVETLFDRFDAHLRDHGLPKSSSAEAPTAPRTNWKPRSSPTSKPSTPIPGPSAGQSPQTISWRP